MNSKPKPLAPALPTLQRVSGASVYHPQRIQVLQRKSSGDFRMETRPAPPVYRPQQADKSGVALHPASNFRLETRLAPPVYRPQMFQPGMQLKPAGNFRTETRPAPPAYRPQTHQGHLKSNHSSPLIGRSQAQGNAQAKIAAQQPGADAGVFNYLSKPAIREQFRGSPQPATKLPRPPGTETAFIQRKINFKTNYRGRKAKNQADLVEQLVSAFGEPNRETITGEVQGIADQGGRPWTMRQIWVAFNKYSAGGSLPVHEEVEFSSSRHAPPPHSVEDFTFTQVTWLVGRVGNRQFKELRNLTVGDVHAEQRFIAQVEGAHKKRQVDLKANPPIVITINNSPCDARCATVLADWAEKWELKRVTIYFCNPYGTKEEFISAITILQGAKIRVHGLDLSKVATDEDLSERALSVRIKIGSDLRTAKAQKWYVSDADSEDEGEKQKPQSKRKRGSGESGSSKKGGPSSKNSKGSASSKRVKVAVPVAIPGVGTVVNVSGSGMNCLIRALLRASGHAPLQDLVNQLRYHLVSQGVAVTGTMLDLANAAGAFLISEMARRHLINPNRGLRVYCFNAYDEIVYYTIIAGPHPVKIWLSDAHFRAIVP